MGLCAVVSRLKGIGEYKSESLSVGDIEVVVVEQEGVEVRGETEVGALNRHLQGGVVSKDGYDVEEPEMFETVIVSNESMSQ